MSINKIFIAFLFFVVIILAACNQNQQVVCNKPYILVGNSCCLDKNNNNVCDKDEETTKNEVACDTPYIKVGNNCCLDKNENKICDSDEKEVGTVTSGEKITFSINDLQSDMGKVLDTPILLTKDPEYEKFTIYSNKISNSKFLGKYGGSTYFKILTKKPEIVIEIANKDNYLRDYTDFYNFVKENKNIFIDPALKSKEIFENEFKNGELPRLISLAQKPKESSRADAATYFGHEYISSKIFFDNISLPQTVSNRIAEIFYVGVNKYKVTINSTIPDTGLLKSDLSNINIIYNMVVYCNPGLIISLNEESFGQYSGSAAMHDTDFDRDDVDDKFFLTNQRDYYSNDVREAQSLIDMCDQRYKFTYVKSTLT